MPLVPPLLATLLGVVPPSDDVEGVTGVAEDVKEDDGVGIKLDRDFLDEKFGFRQTVVAFLIYSSEGSQGPLKSI